MTIYNIMPNFILKLVLKIYNADEPQLHPVERDVLQRYMYSIHGQELDYYSKIINAFF